MFSNILHIQYSSEAISAEKTSLDQYAGLS